MSIDYRVRRNAGHPSRLALLQRRETRLLLGLQDIGLDPAAYGTHTLRRTRASLIYRRTKSLRAVQLLLGHTKLEWVRESTRRLATTIVTPLQPTCLLRNASVFSLNAVTFSYSGACEQSSKTSCSAFLMLFFSRSWNRVAVT